MDPIFAIPLAALIFTAGIVVQAAISLRNRQASDATHRLQQEVANLLQKITGLELEIERLKVERKADMIDRGKDKDEIMRLLRENHEYAVKLAEAAHAARLAHEGA